MSISESLGDRKTVATPAGTIEYRERGSGRPIVFAHGVGVNGDLWRRVTPALAAAGHRTIAPDLPLGAHSIPLTGGPDMSLPGLADILAGFIEALDLSDATLVANDTGGAITQAYIGRRPERIARLVLTSCDAFDRYPPPAAPRAPGPPERRRVRPPPAAGRRVPEADGPDARWLLAARQGGALQAGPATADRVRLGDPPADRPRGHGVLHDERADESR